MIEHVIVANGVEATISATNEGQLVIDGNAVAGVDIWNQVK